jgi:formylglycine-generating enzyme required for sulfatase activity
MSVFTGNSYATPPARANGATVFLPSEDEYYKAAYYDPTKSGTGGYWQYGTQSNTAPSSVAPAGTSNSANIGAGTDGQSAGTLASTMATTGATFDSAVNYLTAVGAYTAATSAYGLYDVSGNVWEWTADWYSESFYRTGPSYNPLNTEPSSDNPQGMPCRSIRGGSWLCNDCYCEAYRVAGRQETSPDTATNHTGFRCAQSPKPKSPR